MLRADLSSTEIVIVFKGIYDWLEQFGTEQTNSELDQLKSRSELLTPTCSQRHFRS